MSGARLLVGRNAAQLLFCFLGSALLNVVSQAFFAARAPGARDAWLAGTLLAGTVASMAGTPAARAFGLGRRPLAGGLALVAAVAALFGGALVVTLPLAFVALHLALRFLLQVGTQELDRRAVALAGAADRRGNDLVGLGLRFGGMLVGPLWFGLVRDAPGATAGVVLGMTALGAWTAWSVAGAPEPEAAAAGAIDRPMSRADRALLVGARALYAAYYLLASSVIYVLSDLHHVRASTRTGGALVTLVYGAAIAATVGEMARGRAGRRSPLGMLPAAAALIAVGLLLPARAAVHPLALGAGGVALGVAFAHFQLAFRDHATHAAVHRGRPALLAAYNDLANTSALVGYAAMAALVAVGRARGVPFAQGVGAGVALLGGAAVPLVLAGHRGAREEALRESGAASGPAVPPGAVSD